MNAIATTAPLHLWKEASTLIHQLFGLFGEPQQIARQQLLGRDAHALLCKWLRAAEMFLRQLLLIEASALPPLAKGRSVAKQPGGDCSTDPLPASPSQGEEQSADHPESWRVSFRVFPTAARTAYRRHPAGNRYRIPKPSRDETYRTDFIDPENARAWKELQRGARDAAKQSAPSPLWGGEGVGVRTAPFPGRAPPSPLPPAPGHRGRGKKETFRSAWPLARRAEALLRAYNNPLPFARRLARKLHAHPERAESIVDSCANPYAHHGVIIANFMIELWTHAAQTLRRWIKHDDSS